VRVPVVQVRVVGVAVTEWPVHVKVAVRFPGRSSRVVGMLVILVVNVCVRMLERLVAMLVVVSLGEVKPHADPHEGAG
jgi:hypothetical protein